MSVSIKQSVLEKIKEYKKIVITRHLHPDGDAIGSSLGLRRILELSFPKKNVKVINRDLTDTFLFLGEEDKAEDIPDYSDALVIILDTATKDRISNPNALSAKDVIRIDHHVEVEQFGTLSWIEPATSSTCEMIADFYDTFKDTLKIDTLAATCLYAGIVTDSGRFMFNSVSPKTLRLSAVLLEQKIQTDTLFNYLNVETMSALKNRAKLISRIRFTENGVAWLHITRDMQTKMHMSREEAGNTVKLMENIQGSLIWITFIDNPDEDSTRVRMRSRFLTIRELAARYNGGGHACACGATVHSPKEMKSLLREADALLKDYKSTHREQDCV